MVNAAAAIDTGSSSLSLFSRAATANAVLSSANADVVTTANPPVPSVANLGQTLRYNSFEFSYRQDFGKIVLLRQEPETGEVVQQFPTEYYLEKYAESERVARQAQPSASEGSESEPTQAATTAVSVNTGASAEAAPVVAPAITSAPALPGGGANGGVDITI